MSRFTVGWNMSNKTENIGVVGNPEPINEQCDKTPFKQLLAKINEMKCCGNCKWYGCNEYECVFKKDYTSGSDK
jgi:hypothetical protein